MLVVVLVVVLLLRKNLHLLALINLLVVLVSHFLDGFLQLRDHNGIQKVLTPVAVRFVIIILNFAIFFLQGILLLLPLELLLSQYLLLGEPIFLLLFVPIVLLLPLLLVLALPFLELFQRHSVLLLLVLVFILHPIDQV